MSNDIRSVTLERRILGGLVSNPKAFLTHSIFDQLNESDFSGGHATLFNILKNQIIQSQPVDTSILTEKIKNFGINLSGKSSSEIFEYLESISFKKATDEVLIETAKELKTLTLRREIRDTVLDIADKMKGCGDLTPDKIVSLADELYNARINSYQLAAQPIDLFENIVETLEEMAANPVEEVGLSTPYPKFNDFFGGLCAGNVYAVVSRTGDGKSTWLNDISIKMSKKHNADCLILDTEMDKTRASLRAAASITGLPYWALKSGNWAKNKSMYDIWNLKKKELEEYKNRVSHLYVANKTIDELESIIRRWRLGKASRSKKEVITVLDYVKLSLEKDANRKEYEMLGIKASRYKDIMMDLEIIGLSAGQANRSGVGEMPADNDAVVAGSDRLLWFWDFVSIFRKKTYLELAEESLEFGTHKLIPLKTRDQGKESAGHQSVIKVVAKDQKGKDKITYRENFINYAVENFRVTERGTLRDIIESQSNQPIDLKKPIQNDPPF